MTLVRVSIRIKRVGQWQGPVRSPSGIQGLAVRRGLGAQPSEVCVYAELLQQDHLLILLLGSIHSNPRFILYALVFLTAFPCELKEPDANYMQLSVPTRLN